jgi:hypothetical protein
MLSDWRRLMRREINVLVCLLLGATLAGCAYGAGANARHLYGGYGFNGGFEPSSGYVAGDGEGYDSGGFGSGYSNSGGIAGAYHYYGY